MRTKLLLLLILAVGAAVQYTNAAEDDNMCNDKYSMLDMERWDEVYDWLEAPPEGADTVSMAGVFYYWIPTASWSSARNFWADMRKIPVALAGDSVYIKMLAFESWHETIDSITGVERTHTTTQGWIKGVREGNSLHFSNNEILAFSEYSTKHYHMRDRHTLYNQKDTLFVNSVQLTNETEFGIDDEGFPAEVTQWNVEYLDEPVRADYDPTTHFISHPSNTLLVSTHQNNMVTNSDMHAEMAIRDFVICKIADNIPDSLPAPVVKYKPGERYKAHIECDTYLDIFTEEGEMLDCDNIYTVYYVTGENWEDGTGEFTRTYNSTSGMNPFKDYPRYKDIGAFIKVDKIEVMCYYEKEDGTRIESPRVKAVDVTGVKDVMAEGVNPNIVGDGNVYDLTGREVNPARLSPGIYIRNGRKFTVTSR